MAHRFIDALPFLIAWWIWTHGELADGLVWMMNRPVATIGAMKGWWYTSVGDDHLDIIQLVMDSEAMVYIYISMIITNKEHMDYNQIHLAVCQNLVPL